MTHNPIALRYTEGKETFAVHLDGSISRPAIGMGPSGGWRLLGFRAGGGMVDFPELARRVVECDALPHALHLIDLDHGTTRQHGHAASAIWAEPGTDAETVRTIRLIDLERKAAARQAADTARLEALERCKRRPVSWRSPDAGITLYRQKGGLFALVDGEAVQEGLEPYAAACALGAAIMEGAGA